MTTKPLDLTKPIKCRDGVVPTIYCTDAPGQYPIHGRLPGYNQPVCWRSDGRYRADGEEGQYDLVNVPEPLVVWLNIFEDGLTTTYKTKESAKAWANTACGLHKKRCIGRHKIEIKNPEGFDDE